MLRQRHVPQYISILSGIDKDTYLHSKELFRYHWGWLGESILRLY
jgi:hypothetical protein